MLKLYGDYPAGLGSLLIDMLKEQYVDVIAASSDGGTLYIEHKNVVWCIGDNCGELHCHKVNTDVSFDVPLTSHEPMPVDVRCFAFMLMIWILDGLRGCQSDFFWRPKLEEIA